ncbi:MAG: TIM barrel protein [Fimbriimonas sp.]
MPVRQSFCLPCFQSKDVPRDVLLREAKATGYEALEIWGWDDSLDALAADAKAHGLRIASMTGHDSIERGLNDTAEHERIAFELRRSIDKAASLAIPGVIVFAGSRHPARTDLEGLVTFAQGIRPILPYAEERGVNLNLELLNSRVDHPGYMADRVDWALAAVEMVAHPRLKLLFDVYHVQIMEGDLVRNLRRCLPHLGHVHTAGNPGRHDLDDTQEINYRAICRALVEGGYDGFVGHELFSRRDRMVALRESFAACEV